MNETRRKPTTGFFYMPSRIDTAVHTKAFDYPVEEHWGGGEPKCSAPWGLNYSPLLDQRSGPTVEEGGGGMLPQEKFWKFGMITCFPEINSLKA